MTARTPPTTTDPNITTPSLGQAPSRLSRRCIWLRKSIPRPTSPSRRESVASLPHRLFTTATALMRTVPTGCNLGILDVSLLLDRDGGILCLSTGSRSRGLLRACGSVFTRPGGHIYTTQQFNNGTNFNSDDHCTDSANGSHKAHGDINDGIPISQPGR
ncbi:hypothetical protein B0T09DRAFT_79221 [Sordaria sp. MPI-SDFR-AT-0083]|nr:hypothetical protein B0T09DRAFT_79221 [Sordaria sp. MPI-SDFR-AT-0083]